MASWRFVALLANRAARTLAFASLWLVGVVPFLVVLFPFYVYLERALPNGY